MVYSLNQVARSVIVVLGIVLLSCTGVLVAEADSGVAGNLEVPLKKRTLIIGKVSENPKKHYKYLKPMVDYAVKHMRDLGYTEGKVLMSKSNRQMISYLKQKKVDWVTETPFSAAIFEQKAGAQFLLKKWKKGTPKYHTVFFTRKDSGICTLSDLKGKAVAFEDSGSSSAYFIPAAVLIREGMTLTQLMSPREKPAKEMVGYAFAGQEINIATWVYRGLTAAGVFNNIDWEKEDHVRKAFKKEMKIFHRTKSFPRAIELVRKDLDPRVKRRLKSILLKAHNDPAAKNVLKSYQKTTKFDELNEEDFDGMNEVRSLMEIVQSELE